MQQFKAFLGRCSKSNDVSDEDMNKNLEVLKEWLDTQSKSTRDEGEGEGQGNSFMGILQAWSFASQVLTKTQAFFLYWIHELTSEGSDLE